VRRHLHAHGIDEAISAIEAATVITKRHGINQPKTIPTCPPDTSGKEKVDVTEATTPMIEKENAINSSSFGVVRNWQTNAAQIAHTENSRLNSDL
jgi:hypothetical protein